MPQPDLLSARTSVLLLLNLQPSALARLAQAERSALGERIARMTRAAATLALPVITTGQPAQHDDADDGLDATIARSLPAWTVAEDQQALGALTTPRITQALAMTGRQQVVIGGLETHSSVLQTAYQLRWAGYTPFAVSDAVAAQSAAASANALTRLGRDGITVAHSESVLAEWLAGRNHPAYDTSASVGLL